MDSLTTLDRFDVYPCPALGLDPEPFAYFTLSLAWRSAVHSWTLPDGDKTIPFSLGEYEEPVRRYLLGEAPFPAETAVLLTACRDGARKDWVSPTGGPTRVPGCIAYNTIIYGLNFVVWFGPSIPTGLRNLCCYSSPTRPLLVTPDCSDVSDTHLSKLATLPIAPKRGATVSDVEAMLGQPARKTTGPTLIYHYPTMEVLFRGGKVERVDERAARGQRARRAARSSRRQD